MTPSDPFEILGIGRDSSLAQARVARRRLAFEYHPDRGGSLDDMRELNEAFDAVVAHLAASPLVRPGANAMSRAQHDVPSFVIDALPAEAFEALLVVTSWIGEVLDDSPPYVLEVHLYEPGECWCRLDLVPDAGASTVSLTVAGSGVAAPPLLDDVRDVWVHHLNQPGAFD